MTGFAAIALHNPKSGENVGGTLRAADIYGAACVIIDGPRRWQFVRHPTNTMKSHRHVPTIWADDLFGVMPYAAVPVAIEICHGAVPLNSFEHPRTAVYIFGAEDATLGSKTLQRCPHRVYIPTRRCMNLAATVNVVLYDRMVKLGEAFETEGCAA